MYQFINHFTLFANYFTLFTNNIILFPNYSILFTNAFILFTNDFIFCMIRYYWTSNKFLQVNNPFPIIKLGLFISLITYFVWPSPDLLISIVVSKVVMDHDDLLTRKKHRKFCWCGLTHLDATSTFKNCPNTYETPCMCVSTFIS